VLLSTDMVRRDLGLTAGRRDSALDKGAYSPANRRAVYRELAKLGEAYLARDHDVVLDGTFGEKEERAPVIEAVRRSKAPFLLVECAATDDMVRERQSRRASQSWSASEGSWEVYLEQKRRFQAPDEVPPAQRLVIDTSLPLAEQIARVERAVQS
jgi:predicted kinase